MTKDEIMAMQPGREIDSIISEKIMGYVTHGHFREKNGVRILVQPYSTDITAAWEIVEKITQEYRITLYKLPGGAWSCKFSDFPPIIEPTAPEAICKSALLAVME